MERSLAPPEPASKPAKALVGTREVPLAALTPKPARKTVKIVDPDELLPAVDWVPAPYQEQASKFLQRHSEGALFLDPGLRKTSTTLDAICELLRKKKAKRFLIIAPVRVCHMVWPAEIAKWKKFSHLRFEILHGPKKEEALRRDADIYLINPQGLEWLFGATAVRSAIKGKVTFKFDPHRLEILAADSLVVDEISQFKHADSGRSKILKPFLHAFLRRWGLTGSPASNGLLDLFGIMYVIDLGYSLGEYITHYRNAYFKPAGFGGYSWSILPGAKEAIYKRIAPRVFRLEDKDWVKIPELTLNVIRIDLPPDVRKIYDALEKDFIVQLEKGTVVAANAAVASGKCRQVASGGLYLEREVDEDGRRQGKREWQNLHGAKTEVVRELVDELMGQQVMVAYDFEHDLDRLLKELGKDTPVMGGGTSAKKSVAMGKAWNAGRLSKMLVHPGAVAFGLNLQESDACHIVIHTPIWDFELWDQLLRRLRRSGNRAARIFVHVLVARDTVDEAVVAAIARKDKVQGDLMAALKEYTRRRLRIRKG